MTFTRYSRPPMARLALACSSGSNGIARATESESILQFAYSHRRETQIDENQIDESLFGY
jgi:hypothetical protein